MRDQTLARVPGRPRGNARRHALAVVLPFAAGYFFSYALRTVNAVAAPALSSELGLSAADLGLLSATYFMAFAAAQLPLGLALDRYGPARVERVLLVVAALGCFLFALAGSTTTLMLARALIGLGVAACLMAAFKAFVQHFPAERQASLTGLVMAAGGLGALSVSAPLERLLPLVGWRGAVAVLGLGCLLVALLLRQVPEPARGAPGGGLAGQLRELGHIARSAHFWRYAPHSAFVIGGFMAIQGLWAVPWMMAVSGASRAEAANALFLFNLALLSGQLLLAALATRVLRRGLRATHLLGGGVALALLAQAGLLGGLLPPLLGWLGYGLGISTGALMYSALSASFPLHLSGRVTTLINLLAFIGAFTLQWGFGAVIDALLTRGETAGTAYRLAFTLCWGLQLAAFLWFLLGAARARRGATWP